MPDSPLRSCADKPRAAATILVGVTSQYTCPVLKGRLRALRQAGFRVFVTASPGPLLDRVASGEGVEAIGFGMRREIAPLADLVSLVRLWILLRRLRPDIVEFSTPKAGLLGSMAAWLCGIRPRVYMLRGLKLETTRGLKRYVLIRAEKLAASCANVVLCNSASLRDRALELGLVPEEKLVLLGEGSSNGVDTVNYSPGQSDVRARLGIDSEAKVIGFVGRLTRDKGVPELVEAFETIVEAEPSARLLLVGEFDRSEDSLGSELRSRIENHPQVHVVGFVDDTTPYYRALDVLVLPTWREGFPNVVLEAEATGIPVVTTLATGSRDSVLPEVTGLLIPPGNSVAIAEAVLRLLRNRALRLRMGRAAREWVLEHYSDQKVLALTVAYYKKLLEAQEGVVVT